MPSPIWPTNCRRTITACMSPLCVAPSSTDQGQLYCTGNTLIVYLDSFPEQEALIPLIDQINQRQYRVRWLADRRRTTPSPLRPAAVSTARSGWHERRTPMPVDSSCGRPAPPLTPPSPSPRYVAVSLPCYPPNTGPILPRLRPKVVVQFLGASMTNKHVIHVLLLLNKRIVLLLLFLRY